MTHQYMEIKIRDLEKRIETLEQEPCEDAISRKKVTDIIYRECSGENLDIDFAKVLLVQGKIKALPPVNPQPKTGHWILDDECKEHGHCSHCGYGSVDLVDGKPHNFCSNCGAKMVEPQESEDKE